MSLLNSVHLKEELDTPVSFKTESGKQLEMLPADVGYFLIKLETIRESLGHKCIAHSFRYINGPITKTPAYVFVRDIILHEYHQGRNKEIV